MKKFGTPYDKTMNVVHPIAVIGELIGDPARAAILSALLDGRTQTAGELAFTANISTQSASGHLARTCYDHLAGRIAVELAGNLQAAEVIRTHSKYAFQLGPHGER